MVEILGGALAGGDVEDKWARGNWGNLVLAIDPELVGPTDAFKAKVAALLARVQGAKPLPEAAGKGRPCLPGERSEARAAEVAATGRIKLERNVYEGLVAEFEKTGGKMMG
jgi:L-2-hydroxycarboxylate dehydrogenase (NAD+)